MRGIALTIAMACLFGLAAIAVQGQTETGQIIGKVTDEKGAVVPGASVTIKYVATTAFSPLNVRTASGIAIA